jgi:hypothetical protein
MGHIISLRHQEKRELTIKQLINTTYGSAIRRVEVSQVEKKKRKNRRDSADRKAGAETKDLDSKTKQGLRGEV